MLLKGFHILDPYLASLVDRDKKDSASEKEDVIWIFFLKNKA